MDGRKNRGHVERGGFAGIGTREGLPALAFTACCHICDRAYISVIREFPVPYVCWDCDTKRHE